MRVGGNNHRKSKSIYSGPKFNTFVVCTQCSHMGKDGEKGEGWIEDLNCKETSNGFMNNLYCKSGTQM
jgi:hypothetical protein